MKFAKATEHNFCIEIFGIVKVIHRRPRAVYEIEDLNGTAIDPQFYQEELTCVLIISRIIRQIKYCTRDTDATSGKFSSAGNVSVRKMTRGSLHQV